MKLADSILRMTPGATDGRGLILFRLAWWLRGTEKAHLAVVSGQPGAQVLRTAAEATPGQYEPVPEGVYHLGDADAPTGVNRTSGDFGPGLGSIWVGVHPEPGYGEERFIGIHEDANSDTAPGTAACLGALSKKDMERIASWFAGSDRPRQLVVDYGRGTVPGAPKAAPAKPTEAQTPPAAALRMLFWAHTLGNRLRIPAGPGDYKVTYVGGEGGAASFVLEPL